MVLSGENINAKVWYMNKYPSDEYAIFLKDGITFGELWNCLKNGNDFYRFSGANDSLVRERLFVKMAEIFNVPYDFIYGMWIASDV